MFKVLAATDLSPAADAAVQRAAQIASQNPGSQLTLLHVITEPSLDVVREMLGQDGEDVAANWRVNAERDLGELARKLRDQLGVIAEVRVLSGRPSAQIIATAESIGADLAVFGSHGERGAVQALLGGTVERVLREGPCRALAVKRPPLGPYGRVLVPVDFSEHSAPAIEWTARTFPEAEITVFHAYHVPFESKLRLSGATESGIDGYREQLRAEAEKSMAELLAGLTPAHLKVSGLVVVGEPIPAILEQERVGLIDLIVLGKRGSSRLAELLLGSVTQRVMLYSAADVLVSGATIGEGKP